MTDHAAAVREALGDPETCTPDDFADSVRAGLAAVDALEADLAAARDALRAVRAWMAQEEEAGVFVPGIVYQIIADALAEADA